MSHPSTPPDSTAPDQTGSNADRDIVGVLLSEVERLRDEVAALQADRADAPFDAPFDPAGPPPTSRRQMLRVAGASAVGLFVGAQAGGATPVAASDHDVVKNTVNPITATTTLDGSVDGPVLTAFNRSNNSLTNALYGRSRAVAPTIRGDNEETGGLGGIAVGGNAPGGRDLYAFGSGRIAMNDHAFSTASNDYSQGEIHQAGGALYAMVTPTVRREIVGPAAAGALHPIAPTRVYDSRQPEPSPGRLGPGATRVISVATGRSIATGAATVADLVPAGATAIMFNVTATGTEGPGFLTVSPASVTDVAASTINWTESNVTIANSSMVGLSGDRLIRVTCAPTASTDFAIDVIGYYS